MSTVSLWDLYHTISKHSQYQILPPALQKILPLDTTQLKSTRHEKERLSYIKSKLDFTGFRISDIGGNTGYFSIEMLELGADSVDFYEGNKAHFDFVTAASKQLQLETRLHTFNQYVNFDNTDLKNYDCTLLLNVLHHIGDDFGDQTINIEKAKIEILRCLHELSHTSRWLILQLGFNWKGDRNKPLFDHGTKSEIIDFITQGTAHCWKIHSIGIAEKISHAIHYSDQNNNNIQREDSLGEFLNRPLFILQSISASANI